MKSAIVKFEPFLINQTVFICEGESITPHKVKTLDVMNFLKTEPNLKAVHLFGTQDYLNHFSNELNHYNKYEKKDGRIEIFINE